MLKVMRNSFEQLKWILIAIVVIFVFFIFAQWGGGDAQSTAPAYAAKVNGDTIGTRDFDRALKNYQSYMEQMYRQPVTDEMLEQMGGKRQVLDQLVDQTLMLQQARKLHLTATPEEIRARILELPVFNPDGKFIGPEIYQRYVTGPMGYSSTAEFEETLGREITVTKLENALQNSVVVSPKAAENEYRRTSDSAKIRYVMNPASSFLATVQITPAEVQTYYNNNVDKYTHGEQRQVKYLLADLARIRASINPTDEDLRKRYEATKEDYKSGESVHAVHILIKTAPTATPAEDAAAKAKAEGLVAQLRGGANFAALAAKNSDDPGSAVKGGDVGFFAKGAMVPEFEAAAFSLPINQISDPVKSQFGYHILKVLEKRAAGYKPFEEVKEQLRQQYVDQTSKDQGRDAITALHTRIQDKKPANAQEFSALASGNISSNDTQWIGKSGAIPGIGPNPALVTWAFSAKQGDTGDVIGTQRGPAIPYLAAVRPAGVTQLEEIREKVESDAKMGKARELAKGQLAAAMSAGAIDAVAARLGLAAADTTVTHSGYITGITGDTAALVTEAMSSAAGQVKGPLVVGDGAIVFQVTEQHKADQKNFDDNREQYMTALRQREVQSLRTALLARLKKESKIQINEELVTPKAANGLPSQRG
jgi:peptidyl-prolyl cis-trans isomerase D